MTQANTETFHFDDNFQQGIFQLMMVDGDFAEKASTYLKPEYFKNQYYGYFFNTLAGLVREFRSPPSPVQVVNEMLKLKSEERPPYTAIFERIIKPTGHRDFPFIRSRLAHFVKRSKMWQLNQKMVQNKFSDPDALYQAAMKDFQDIESVNFHQDEFMSLRDAQRVMAESADTSKNLIPLGLPTLDEALGGGIPRGTLTTILGPTNIGKSIALVNLAHNMAKAGYKVLYVNLEGMKAQPLLRLISRGIQVPYGRVRFNKLNDHELMKFNKYMGELGDRVQIKHVNNFGFTVEELYSYCKSKKEKFDFDVLLLDYGQLLGSKQKHEGLRHQQAYVHRGLDNISSNLNIAVVTVAQGTRDVQQKNRKGTDLLRMDDISECFEIIRVSAQVLTLNRSEQDEASGRVRILLDKQRDGKKGVIEICKTNFQTISMFGTSEEGLGFISPDEYLAEELQLSVEQGKDGSTISIGAP
jgi:replicative DNA helicase